MSFQQQIFQPAREHLLRYHDEREQVIRLCRDINSYSKKLIFTFHRITARSISQANKNQLLEYLDIIANALTQIHKRYWPSSNAGQFKLSISNSIEEMIEAFTFMYFVMHGELLTYQQLLKFCECLVDVKEKEKEKEEEKNDKEKEEEKNDKEKEEKNDKEKEEKNVKEKEEEKIDIDIKEKEKNYKVKDKQDLNDNSEDHDKKATEIKTSNTDFKFCLTLSSVFDDFLNGTFTKSDSTIDFIYIGDFYMGLFDLTGEIMRYCISNVSLKSTKLLNPECLHYLDFMTRLYTLTQELFNQFPDHNVQRGVICVHYNAKLCGSIRKKMEVFKLSLEKVQGAICDALIRNNEENQNEFDDREKRKQRKIEA